MPSSSARWALFIVIWPLTVSRLPADDAIEFVRDIQPIMAAKCVRCHGDEKQEGNLRLDRKADANRGGNSGPLFDRRESLLVQRITAAPDERMPPEGEPLSTAQIDTIRRWIAAGAPWPDGVDKVGYRGRYDWWSFQPMRQAVIGQTTLPGDWARMPIDDFIWQKLHEHGLSPAPEADRRTLIRRLSFDLLGLPPDPEAVDVFVADSDPLAYEKLVDRMLASPQYGERWARHWLDVVHYGDTHGYDKDKPRPNAWPYRDYVIRALNADKPYARFVQEQLAGDALWPETEDGITATGFIAAGPWDFIGHAELPETKYDGQIARLLDRDDMVTNTLNTFCSLTVQCARCHNHKFDPVIQTDYYRLQAVFAAVDRADRPFDVDMEVASRRAELRAKQQAINQRLEAVNQDVLREGGTELAERDAFVKKFRQVIATRQLVEFGYHSQIEPTQDVVKWVQLDLGRVIRIEEIVLVGCHDDFNGIGAGFGFPVRYRLELSNDPEFQQKEIVLDETQADFKNPGVTPIRVPVKDKLARYVRITATKLAPRVDDFIFALAEVKVLDGKNRNVAGRSTVMALDSIEAAPRWRKTNLVDGLYHGVWTESIDDLQRQRDELLVRLVRPETRQILSNVESELQAVNEALTQLPSQPMVFVGKVHSGSGNFLGTGASGGKPRPIHVLKRGDLRSPGEEVGPGFVPLSADQNGEFDLPADHTEADRRVGLANWITQPEHPLTWRSIVNRVWQYHFGRGLVDSPNDFGHMGQLPSHPELLDWLALEFRDHDGSLKHLHRLIVTSTVYRQSSESNPEFAAKDVQNVYLWRMNRRRLEAEAVRDSVLHLAGKLNDRMTGPAFQDFVVIKPEHSPHYEYRLYDPEDPASHRRSVYRFLVRSQPQPFMTTLDCADPSMQVDKRNETVTALQALALLNNKLMLVMSKHMAERIRRDHAGVNDQIAAMFRLALSRMPTDTELSDLTTYANEFGLENVCRVMFNLNEFVFVD